MTSADSRENCISCSTQHPAIQTSLSACRSCLLRCQNLLVADSNVPRDVASATTRQITTLSLQGRPRKCGLGRAHAMWALS
jgi:hypothetical protein